MAKYTSSYRRAQTINGLRGYDYEIRESLTGRVVRCGWTAGGIRDAKQEIERAIRDLEAKGPTLNEVLAKLGYTTSPAVGVTGQLGAKNIIRDGATAFTGTADDVWKWLRATGQYKEAA